MTMRVKWRKAGSKSATNWLSASVSGFEVMKKLTIIDRIIQYHSSDNMSGQTQQLQDSSVVDLGTDSLIKRRFDFTMTKLTTMTTITTITTETETETETLRAI